jgi:hypothetical protein
MRRALALLTVIAGAACTEDVSPPEEIKDLRILGVRAEPPGGPAGTVVQIEGLIVSPTDEPFETAWLACAGSNDPTDCVALAGTTLPLPCGSGSRPVCLLGSPDPAPYTLPAGTSQVLVAVLTAETAPGGLAGCQRTLVDEGTLPAYCRLGLKRIPVGGPANANPLLTGVTVTGDAVSVTLNDGAAEATPDGPEDLFLSWFVTTGELDDFRTEGDVLVNQWTLHEGAGSLYVVVRDGRGGESWISTSR